MDSSRRGDGAVPLALVVMSRCRRNLRNAVLVLSRGGRDGSCRGDEIHRRIALALLRRRRGIFALAQKRRGTLRGKKLRGYCAHGYRHVRSHHAWHSPGSFSFLLSTGRAAGNVRHRLVWLQREAGCRTLHRDIEVLYLSVFFSFWANLRSAGCVLILRYCRAVTGTEAGELPRRSILFRVSRLLFTSEYTDCQELTCRRPVPVACRCSRDHRCRSSLWPEPEFRPLCSDRSSAGG